MAQRLEILEVDVGYYLRRWGTTGTTGLYTHAFTEYDVSGVWVNGTQYTLAASLAACGSTSGTKTYFLDVGTSIYVHEHTNGDPNIGGTTVKINSTWGFSRPGAVIPKSDGVTVRPIFYDGRLKNVPSISYKSSPDVLGGGAVVAVGEASLENSDGYFDSRVPKAIWDNQPSRLYEGTLGGTLPADFTLRQSCVTSVPTIDQNTLNISLQGDLDSLKQNINQGNTLPQTLGYVPGKGQPAPVVFGPFAGVPIYFWDGPTGTGTYYVACHSIGTITSVRDESGGTHPITSVSLLSGSPSKIVINDSQFGSFASQPLYADGTGYVDAGGTPMTAGSMFQFMLATRGKIGTSKIDLNSISQLDSERSVNLSAWFGRGETIETGLNYISRSAFSQWTVGRNGKYTINAINNNPGSNLIPYGDFESGLNAENGTPLEDVSNILTSRLTSSKMLIYNNLAFKDSPTNGLCLYRGETNTFSGILARIGASFRLHGVGTPSSGNITFLSRHTGGSTNYTAYELVMATNGTLTMYYVDEFGATLFGSYAITPFSGTQLRQVILRVDTDYRVIALVDGVARITATPSASQRIAQGYAGLILAANATTVEIGTLVFTYGANTITENLFGISSWTNASSGSHKGTQPGHFAFDGNKVVHISKPSGAAGSLARIFQGSIGGSAETDYVMSCVAALQSGSAGSFSISYKDSSGTEHISGSYSLGTGTYNRVLNHFRPTSTGIGTVSIYPSYNNTSEGTVWVDNLEMYPVKTIHYWQNKAETRTDIKVPIYYQVAVGAYGELTGTEHRIPPEPFQSDSEKRINYYVSDTNRNNAQYLYSGMESLEVNALTWSQNDAQIIADAIQDYYSKPRISIEIEFLDWQGETINLWDILYFPDGRIPGLPDGYRLFKVVELEDRHPDNGPPQMWIRCEIPYNPAYDIMDV